jgi:hypothetical protein
LRVQWCRMRCRMHAPGFSSYRAGRVFWSVLHAYLLASFVLIFWSAWEAKSSIIFFYCCLDSWTVPLSSIIVLAIVQSLYIPFAMSSNSHSRVFLDFSGYGLPHPNDCKYQSRILACHCCRRASALGKL